MSFENISVLDSYLHTQVYNHKIEVVRFRVKSTHYYESYGPFSPSESVFLSIFLFKKDWCIGFIFYTQVYNHKM